MQAIVGMFLIILGIWVIMRRYIVRRKGISIMFSWVKPIKLFKNNRGFGIYGYECYYTYNGNMHVSQSVEIGIYIWSIPKKGLINSMGIINPRGKVSCNKIYSTEITGAVSIIYGLIFLLQ